MSKYDPLRHSLQARSRGDAELTFEEIEEILGFELPRSAREHNAWWANERGTHVQAKAWMDAGWQVWRVRRSEGKVYFRSCKVELRTPSAGVSETATQFVGDDAILIDRAALKGGVIRMLEDYREAHGGDLAGAAAGLLNELALERRRQLLDWIRANAPKVPGDSTDLIREDRDSR